jgi:hypothetical protein
MAHRCGWMWLVMVVHSVLPAAQAGLVSAAEVAAGFHGHVPELVHMRGGRRAAVHSGAAVCFSPELLVLPPCCATCSSSMLTGCACQVLVASVFSRSCAKSSDLQAPNLAGQHMCSTGCAVSCPCCSDWQVQPGIASPEAPIHTQQDHCCHLQAFPRASTVAIVDQVAQLVVGEVLAVQQIPSGGIGSAAHNEHCEITRR